MQIPGVVWVALILLLIPVIQTWIGAQWPEQQYAITALIVGVLGAVAKWLQLYFSDRRQPADAPPEGAAAAPIQGGEKPGKVRRWLVG